MQNILEVPLEFSQSRSSSDWMNSSSMFVSKLARLSTTMTDKSKKSYLLQLFSLPILNNLEDLSVCTHFSKKILYRLSKFNSKHYARFSIPKKSGGNREILCPSLEMKAIQVWILRSILEKIQVSKAATAFRPKTSIAQNVDQHLGNQYVYCLDLENFFPSISYSKVYTIFNTIGYIPHVAHILASLCTCDGKLPQGAVTSPALSNIICLRLDNRLNAYVGAKNISYTRYADDICFSALSDSRLWGIRNTVKRIIESEKFVINKQKTRMQGPTGCRKITGLVFNKDSYGVGRKKKRVLRAKIFNYISTFTSMSPDVQLKTAQHIHGWISFLNSVDSQGCQQLTKFSKIVFNQAVVAKKIDPAKIPAPFLKVLSR